MQTRFLLTHTSDSTGVLSKVRGGGGEETQTDDITCGTSGWCDDIQHGALGHQVLVVDHLHFDVVAGAEVQSRDVVHHLLEQTK